MKISVSLCIVIFHVIITHASCPNDCNGNGWCSDGRCSCAAGYYEKDCSKNIKDEYGSQLIGIQVFIGTLFLSIATLCAIALYHVFARRFTSVPLVNNIQLIVFGSYFIVSVVHTIYSGIDPLRVWGIMNIMSCSLLFATFFPFSLFAFVSVLFHWYAFFQIDLINISVNTLRKEEMLQKISINYKPKEITLEDMVEKLKFLGKLKLPFAILIALLFVIIYVTQTLAGIEYHVPVMLDIMFVVAFLYYGTVTIGFLVYRKKLISIMPFQLTRKVQRLTDRITSLCIVLIVALIILAMVWVLVPRDDAQGYLALWTIIELTIATVSLANVCVFLNWKKQFPFVAFSGTQSTKGSSHGGQQVSAELEVEEEDNQESQQTAA